MPATLTHVNKNFDRLTDAEAIKLKDKLLKENDGDAIATWKLFVEQMIAKGKGADIPGTTGAQYRPKRARRTKAQKLADDLYAAAPVVDTLGFTEMQSLLKENDLPATGNKSALSERLLENKLARPAETKPAEDDVDIEAAIVSDADDQDA